MSPHGDAALSAREVRAAVPVFAALGDETRLGIVRRLATGTPLSIAALTSGSGVTRQAVTKHLQVLDHAGLVRSQWRGRERLWALKADRLQPARRSLDLIAAQWDDALGRLQAFVEPDVP
jgi:DNA-binding transcriptional ArsR family regulator